MIAHSSTPFKVLENPGDENDSTVIRKSFKGSKTVDFSSKALSSFSTVTKAGGLSSVTKSTRKPLLDLSKGQLNSRLSTTSAKPHKLDESAKRMPRVEKVVRIDIPVINLKKASTSQLLSAHLDMEHKTEDMICAGSRVDEDPYDLVMRKADALKVSIVPQSGGENTCTSLADTFAEIQKYTDNIKFDSSEFEIGNLAFSTQDTLPDYPEFF